MLALIIAVAVLASSLVTLLAVMFTSRDTVPKGYVPEGYISIEDAQALISSVTLSAGAMRMEFQDLSDAEASQIASGADELWDRYERNPMADGTVEKRDWSRYASRIATEGMTAAEKALYDRYDSCCRKYLETGVDGYQGGKPGSYFYYASEVRYGDLGLSKDQAQNLFYWFKFNNPQYYFLRNAAATSGSSMFPTMYEKFSSGSERAKTTNELFDKLDGWIASISDDEVTSWQMELAANDLLCRRLEYDENEPFYQSMYSAVLLERTVCAGYSETFCAMMNAVGVNAMVALNDIHAWNVVKFDDGNYYVVDVLWNENHQDNDSPNRTYFNVGEVTAKARDSESAEHTFGSDLAAWAPGLSQKDYLPTEHDLTGSGGAGERLGVPQNLRAAGEDDGERIPVEWDPVDGASQYMVELYSGDKTTLYLSDTFEDNGVKIRYGSKSSVAVRVRSEDGERVSDWSDFLVLTTKAEAAEPTPTPGVTLDAPKNITITKDEPDITHFSWDPVDGADRYEVTLFKDARHTQTWLSGFETEPSAGYKKLQPGTTYHYGVRAMKTVDGKDYYSEWAYFSHTTPKEASNPTVSAPPSVEVAAPTNVHVIGAGSFTGVSWNAVADATGYEACRYEDSSYSKTVGPVHTCDASSTMSLFSVQSGETLYYGVRAVQEIDGVTYYSPWVNGTARP